MAPPEDERRMTGRQSHPSPLVRRLIMVGLGRFELPTSRLSSARSNQLSYKPEIPWSWGPGTASLDATRTTARDARRQEQARGRRGPGLRRKKKKTVAAGSPPMGALVRRRARP